MHLDRRLAEASGCGWARGGTDEGGAVKELAQTSVAAPELEQQVRFEMRLLIAQHDLFDQQIASADARVASLLDGEVSQRLLSIPGNRSVHGGHAHGRDRRHLALY